MARLHQEAYILFNPEFKQEFRINQARSRSHAKIKIEALYGPIPLGWRVLSATEVNLLLDQVAQMTT